MIDTYRKVLRILDRHERRRLYLLLAMFLLRGPVEVMGIASIMPFLAVLANPQIIETNAYFAAAYAYLGFSSTTGFLQFLGAGLFVLLVTLIGFEALTQYATVRFSQMRTYSLSCRLLSTYLHQPYAWFLNRHSADLGKSVLTEVTQVVDGALMPCLTLLSSVLVAAFVIALVVAVDPVVAVTAAALIGGSYGLIYLACRNHLSRIGADRVLANRQRYQLAQEATGGIKDVKVLGLEAGYVRRFRDPAHRFARHQATNRITAALPGFGLQALVYGGGLLLILWLLAVRDGDLSAILPVIGVYALAGQRLMPTLQRIFQSITALRFSRPALDSVYADIEMAAGQRVRAAGPTAKPLSLRDRLELIDVRFTYPNAERAALQDVTLTIPANTTVGLVGPTGSGKTTAVDLLLGLLLPQQGELRVDGTPITDANVRAWQRSVGYVPQHIFLTDDMVAANIAFGIPPAKVDMAAVERCARIAELHDFVVEELPHGYRTLVGERGVRLSGGQRQRIGIARALYHDPDVLILDEATSALDNLTERAVMDAVRNLGHRKTIIMIAHRLSTVEKCDIVFQLNAGRLISHGKIHDIDAEYSIHKTPGFSFSRETQK